MHTPFQGLSTLFSIHAAKELDRDLIFCLEERASRYFSAPEKSCLCLILAFFRTNHVVPGTSRETFLGAFRPSVSAHTMVLVSEGSASQSLPHTVGVA